LSLADEVFVELPGKVAVITGASRGIGRALAFALAESGCKLLLTALEKDELAFLANVLTTELGASVDAMPADLVKDSNRRLFLDWISTREEPPDILINNAGGGHFGRFTSSSWSDIERTLILNIHVPTFLIRGLIPVLSARPQAKIVNISSGISRLPYPGLAVYGAAKGFLSSLSESLTCELAGTNISILCFHPGFTETHFMSSAEMDMSRVPGFLIRTPEVVASRIVKSIKKESCWAYSDLAGRLGVFIASCLPFKIRTRLFRNLFWRLPHEK
jgi:short-subunit dehydrogenase